MKTNTLVIVLAIIVTFVTGCDEVKTDKSQFNQTVVPTNHWKVVGQGTNGQVVVETKSTNLREQFRVQIASSVVPLTNGQPVRVEMVVRPNPMKGRVDIISSKAYPAME